MHSLHTTITPSALCRIYGRPLPGGSPARRERIVDENRSADDVLSRDKSPIPTVLTIPGIVAKRVIVSFRDVDGTACRQISQRGVATVISLLPGVRFEGRRACNRCTVPVKRRSFDLQLVTGYAGESLDVVLIASLTRDVRNVSRSENESAAD